MAIDPSSIGVRVRPNANEFITDLRKDLAAKRYTFVADVKANTDQATKDVREWATTALKRISAKVNVGADLSDATTAVREWRERQRGIKTNIPIGADLGEATRDVTAWRARQRDNRTLIPVAVTVDTRDAEGQVTRFAREPKSPVEVAVDLDLKQARLRKLELDNEMKARKIEVPIEPKVDRSAWNSVLSQLKSDLGGISGLGIGGRRAQASGALGALGIAAIGEAVPIAVAGVSALAQAIVQLAGAAAILPGAMGVAALSLITFKVGISDVSAALTAMTGVWDQTATQINTQAQAVVSAQNGVSNAAETERKAQQAVGDARRSATNDLRNLTNELRRSTLNEAQAILDVQKAKDVLAKGGFKTQTEQTQAILDEKKAEENLIEVKERNGQLRQKAATDQAKGVEGSDKVVNAQDNLTRAIEASTTAQQNLEKVLSGGAAGKYADALAKLGPNARAFVEAVNSQKSAILNFEDAIQQPLFANLGPRFLTAFKALEPTIRTGMASIASGLNKNILQVFDSLSSPQGKSIIERLLGGTANTQAALTKLIDPVVRGLGTLAAAGAEHLPKVIDLFTRLADRFATFIETADRNGKLDEWMNNGIKALGNLADIGVNLLKIIGDLGNAFGGNLIQSIKDATDHLVTFLESATGKQGLKDMVAEGVKSFKDLMEVLKELAPIIPNLLRGAKEAFDTVKPILKLLADIAGDLNKIPHLVEFAFGGILLSKIASPFLTATVAVLDLILGKLGLVQKALPAIAGAEAAGAAGGAAAAGAAGAGGAAAGGVKGALSSGGVKGALKWIAGPAGATGVGAPLVGLALMASVAGDLKASDDAKIAAYEEAHASAPTPEDKAAVTKLYLNSTRILNPGASRGNFGAGTGIKRGSNLEKSIAEDIGAGQLPGYSVDSDGRIVGPGGRKLPTYGVGGFTDWPQMHGKMALLHGKEYIQPADTVSHYGLDAMKAIHEKRATVGFYEGGFADYFDPRLVDPVTGRPFPKDAGPSPAPQGGGISALAGHLMQGLGSIKTGVGDAGAPAPVPAPGLKDISGAWGPRPAPPAAPAPAAPAPPPVGLIPGTPGVGTGPAPGPPASPASVDPNVPYSGPIGPSGSPINFTIPGIGITIPIGNTGLDSGWPGGSPPVGLGGGPDGFDIRTQGIGPGPPGSTPNDWTQWVANFASKTATSLGNIGLDFASSFFGLAPLSSSPYVQAASALGQHFIDSRTNTSGVQAPGAADANAAANAQIGAYNASPQNPADVNASPVGPGTSPIAAGAPPDTSAPAADASAPAPTSWLAGYDPVWSSAAGVTPPPPSPLARPSATTGLPYIIPGAAGQGFLGLRTSGGPGAPGGASGPIPGLNQEIWNNTQTGQKIGEAGGKPVGPGTDQPGYYRNDWGGHTGHTHTSFNTSPTGEFYGLPKGTDIRQGAAGFPSWVYALGARYGVEASTYPGHQESSGYNRGIDWWPKGHSDMSGASYTPAERAHLQAFASGIASQGGGAGVGGAGSERGALVPTGNVPNLGNPAPPQQAHPGWWSGGELKKYAPSYASLPGIIAGSGGGTGFMGLRTSAKPGQPPPAFTGDKGQLKMMAYQLYRQAGFPPGEWGDFDWLVSKESGWSPTAQNPHSTAHGLGQFLNTTWASVGGHYTDDPALQIQYMLTYLKQRPAYHGSPAAAHQFHLANNWYDWGGWLHPGWTMAYNSTGQAERVLSPTEGAGYKTGSVPPPPPGPSFPRGPSAQMEIPKPTPAAPGIPPPVQAPPKGPGGVTPPLPPPGGGLGPMPTSPSSQAPGAGPSGVLPLDIGTGPGAGGGEEHIHPALKKGIESGAAALGNVAGAALGMGGMGGLGGFASGAFKQGGKIIEGIANVASAFLVGSVTSGTTQNPYGETQRGSNPTGGTVIDNSSHQHGDVYTNDLDEYFRRLDTRNSQQAQATLGRFG